MMAAGAPGRTSRMRKMAAETATRVAASEANRRTRRRSKRWFASMRVGSRLLVHPVHLCDVVRRDRGVFPHSFQLRVPDAELRQLEQEQRRHLVGQDLL